MRIIERVWKLATLAVASLILTNGVVFAGDQPTVHVKAVVKDGAVRLEAQASGPFEYTTYRPSDSLYVLDLSGVSAAESTGARIIDSDLVKSYRVLTYQSGQKPVVRVEILLAKGVNPQLERNDKQDLTLLVSPRVDAAVKPSASAPVMPVPSVKPAAAKLSDAKIAATEIQAIEHVNLSENGDHTQVNVLGSGHLTYHATRLENPDRLVLDFEGAHIGTLEKNIPSNLDPVREIRLSQFKPEVLRVVIDLRQPAKYSINAGENAVTVAFDPAVTKGGTGKSVPQADQPSNLETAKATAPKPAQKPVRVETVAVAKPANVPARAPAALLSASMTQPMALATPVSDTSGTPKQAEVFASAYSPEPAPASAPAPLIAISNAPAPAALLPVSLTQPVALATPVSESSRTPRQAEVIASTYTPEPAPAPAPPPAPVSLAAPAANASTPVAASPASSPAPAPKPSVAPVGKYTGEPISVNLKDVDLRDFFRLIHEISSLNVVVDPAVKGNLTIVLDDVPWDQALDIVLKNNDLDKQLDGNVLRVATKETLKKEAEDNRDLAKAQAEAADVVTTTRVLSYSKAADMVNTLKKFLSSRGDVFADTTSNTLIVRDIPSTLPVIDNLLRQLDRKAQQVDIEARVVEASRSFSRELGSQLGLGGQAITKSTNNTVGGNTTVGTSQIIHTPAPPLAVTSGSTSGATSSGSLPLLTNLGTSVPTSGISYAFSSANFALDYIISAAEDRGVGKLLSKPHIIAQNNQKGTAKQGVRVPVQTIINNTVSVQFVDAVLELDVTPQITAEGTILLDVDVKNDQIDPSIPRVQGIPAIDTEEANTKVLVNDGGTIVIGGIIISQQRTDIQQVPLFGSIPLLGNLFRHTTISSNSSELLFFLTPRILPG